MKPKTISELIPQLDAICDEMGIEKKFVSYRNMPGQHGYQLAYSIWRKRNGYHEMPIKQAVMILLSTRAYNYAHKFS